MVFGSGFSDLGFVVRNDSKLFGFGFGLEYQCGISPQKDNRFTEIKFFSQKRIAKICCGIFHSIFFTKNNEVYSTGDNEFGQLGVNDFLKRNNPTRVIIKHQKEIIDSPVIRIIDVFVGGFHSIALSNSLDVYSFGRNTEGQLGTKDVRNRKTGTKINLSEKIISLSCGSYCTCFISISGRILFCGNLNKTSHMHGHHNVSNSNVVLPHYICYHDIFKTRKVIHVTCGGNCMFFVSENNRVYVKGISQKGDKFEQLPFGKVISVKCGGCHSFFKFRKKVMLYGDNYYGQIGNGDYKNVVSPVLFSIKGKEIIQSLMMKNSSIHFTKNEVYGCGKIDDNPFLYGKLKRDSPIVFKMCNMIVKKRKENNLSEERFGFLKLPKKNERTFLFF